MGTPMVLNMEDVQRSLTANYAAGRRHQMLLVENQVRIHLAELATGANPSTELEIIQQKIVQQFIVAMASLSAEVI